MKEKASKWNMDLTSGSIGKKLILFALPLLGSSLIQQLYNTVDLLFVGNVLKTGSYAAVGASTLLIICLTGFFTGMSVGSNVVLSQAIGKKDPLLIHDSVHTAVALSLVGGIIVTIVGEAGTPLFLTWLGTDPSIMQEAVGYLRICFVGMVPMLAYNMASGIIRAMGNSTAPLLIQTAGGLANVAADAVLIHLWHSVDGVAWATVVSQTFAAVLSLVYLRKRGGECAFFIRDLCIRKEILLRILKIGVPAGIQTLVITLSNAVAQFRINGRGIIAVSAFTTYFRVELLLYHPIVAIGQAMTTFAGQNIGAGLITRVRKGVRLSLIFGIVLTVALALILLPFGNALFGLFDANPRVLAEGQKIISTTFYFYWIYVILEVLADTLRGCGNSTGPMIMILANICVLRAILLIFACPLWDDIRSIAATYPVSWAGAAVCMSVLYIQMMKKICRKEPVM